MNTNRSQPAEPALFDIFHIIMFIALLTLITCGGVTGGSGAETQASPEIPEVDGGVSISTPNELGLVTVIGDNAELANATVIVDVNSASALNLDMRFIWNALVPSARAETCASSLPVCPEVDSDEKCQFTADAEGEFSLQVPADETDTVSVSYLDTSTCAEVDLIDDYALEDSDVIAVNGVIEDMEFDSINGFAYLIGYEADSQATDGVSWKIDVVDVAERTVDTYPLRTGFDQINSFVSSNGDDIKALTGDEKSVLFVVDTLAEGALPDDPLSSTITLVNSEGMAHGNLEFLTAVNIPDADQSACGTLPLVDTGVQDFTRVLYNSIDANTNSAMLAFIDFQGSPSDTYTNYQYEEGGVITGVMPQFLPIAVTDDNTNETITVNEIVAIQYVEEIESLALLLSLSDSLGAGYYYFTAPLSEFAICHDSEVTEELSLFLTSGLELPVTPDDDDDLQISVYNSLLPTGTAYTTFAAFSHTMQNLSAIDVGYEISELGNKIYNQLFMTYDSDTATLTVNAINAAGNADSVATQVLSNLATGTGSALNTFLPLKRSDGYAEMFLLANDFGGSGFALFGETSVSEFEPDFGLYALDPKEASYDEALNQIIVLDAGFANPELFEDGVDTTALNSAYTLIRFYGLATE